MEKPPIVPAHTWRSILLQALAALALLGASAAVVAFGGHAAAYVAAMVFRG